MGQVRLEFQGELETGKGFSDELRAELRQINVPLSESAAFTSLKQPDAWRIDDLSRDRRYVVRKDETQLMVYIIEQRLTGTFKMPNDLGAYLALSLPLVMGYFVVSFQFLRKQKNGIWIIFVLCAVVAVMTTNLALTLTRAAWVSVTIATALHRFLHSCEDVIGIPICSQSLETCVDRDNFDCCYSWSIPISDASAYQVAFPNHDWTAGRFYRRTSAVVANIP